MKLCLRIFIEKNEPANPFIFPDSKLCEQLVMDGGGRHFEKNATDARHDAFVNHILERNRSSSKNSKN